MTYLDDLADKIRRALPDGSRAPERSDDLFRIYAVLLAAKGLGVTDEDVHDAWVAWMSAHGEDHPAMVPFDELDEATKAEDAPFARAIRTVASGRD